MQKALTDTFIRNVSPPAFRRLEIADLKSTGLSFRVTCSGTRSWCFRFRDPKSGKTSRATIGQYPTLTLGEARARADALRHSVAAGENPVDRKRRERETAATKTFKALADRYMEEHAKRRKKSSDADDRNLRLHVLPKWANRRYEEIGRGDIIALVESIVTAGMPTLANRVQALISSIYSFAVDADLVKAISCNRRSRLRLATHSG